ncbi:hypothetical protein P8452_22768 [Trifolium repens]|nr:hypothetical protein P8452_22768 [Trifolium repens]
MISVALLLLQTPTPLFRVDLHLDRADSAVPAPPSSDTVVVRKHTWYMDTGASSHTVASQDGDTSHEM